MTGTYEFVAAIDKTPAQWVLRVDPATAIKAKRVFMRSRHNIAGQIAISHTDEVARDLEWFLSRYPLEPLDAESQDMLVTSAESHRVLEARVASLVNDYQPQFNMPVTLLKTPRDYQKQAYELLRTRKRFLLGDEVGLGKTLTGLLAAIDDDARPLLVVPPPHLQRRWVTEITESMPALTFEVAKHTLPPVHIVGGRLPDVVIVPYTKLSGWVDALAGRVKTVIFDEVQELRRGTDTNKGWAAAIVSAQATQVMGLSATPVYNYGGETWQIYNIIAPDVLGTRDEFGREWASFNYNGHMGIKDPAALGRYLRNEGLLLARTRKEVGRELPQAVKVPHTVDVDSAALEAIQGDAARLAELILAQSTTRTERFEAAGELDWKLRQATGIAKAPYVAAFVRMILESEHKVALFGWHRAVWDIWSEALAEFKPVMYTGSESIQQKAAAEEAFVNGDSRVLMMSLRSGAGVDGLQRVCSVAVFGELDWSPQVHEQAIGRFRRDGMDTSNPVVAYFLTSDEGSDPAIMSTLQVKRNQAEPIMTNDGTLFDSSTIETNRARTLAQTVLSKRKAA